MPDKKDHLDYLYYLSDSVALVIALLFSATEAYTAYSIGQPYLIKLLLVGVAWFFRYLYIVWYTATKFFMN